MSRLLLLEDDESLAETLIELLESESFGVVWAKNGEDALERSYHEQFDLFIFDVNVPLLNGFDLLQSLRDAEVKTPTIFLTALSDIASLSKGFEVGADDYIKKPFDFDELVVRINALLRKSFQSASNIVTVDAFDFHIDSDELFNEKVLVDLTPYELRLCRLFFMQRKHTIAKEDLLAQLSDGAEASEGALRVHINKLRKLGLPITTIKGIGYRLGKS